MITGILPGHPDGRHHPRCSA